LSCAVTRKSNAHLHHSCCCSTLTCSESNGKCNRKCTYATCAAAHMTIPRMHSVAARVSHRQQADQHTTAVIRCLGLCTPTSHTPQLVAHNSAAVSFHARQTTTTAATVTHTAHMQQR
jgi:hypothetical protein